MIVFLYGPDSYRRNERKHFYAEQFHKKYGLPAEPVDLSSAEGWSRFEEQAKSQSLFGAKKLLLVDGASEVEPKKLLPLLKLFLESKEQNLVISEDKKPVKALGLLLAKPVITELFEELKGAGWTTFVKQEVKKSGAKLDGTALAYLAAAYEGDPWSLVTELRKLANYGGVVDLSLLEGMGIETEKNYFAIVQTLRAPAAAARLGALQTLFAMQEPAAKVFNILAALWPQKVADFAGYDKAIKFGRMDYEEALTDLVLGA